MLRDVKWVGFADLDLEGGCGRVEGAGAFLRGMEGPEAASFGLGSALRRGKQGPEIKVREVEVAAKRSAALAVDGMWLKCLSNHVHMLVEAANSAHLSKGMASLNIGLGMRLNQVWSRVGQGSVFKERFNAKDPAASRDFDFAHLELRPWLLPPQRGAQAGASSLPTLDSPPCAPLGHTSFHITRT